MAGAEMLEHKRVHWRNGELLREGKSSLFFMFSQAGWQDGCGSESVRLSPYINTCGTAERTPSARRSGVAPNSGARSAILEYI